MIVLTYIIPKLIALCQDLATDTTVDLTPEARREITQLTFAAIGECKSLERELGPLAHDEAREKIEDALAPIRRRLFGARADIINRVGELSTGWKYGEEGMRLLKINSLCSGNGE